MHLRLVRAPHIRLLAREAQHVYAHLLAPERPDAVGDELARTLGPMLPQGEHTLRGAGTSVSRVSRQPQHLLSIDITNDVFYEMVGGCRRR